MVDDYAHHPTEVRGDARGGAHARRPAASSPPSSRTCSRARATRRREFGAALALADVVVVLDVYPARERAEDFPGVTGRLVAAAAADAPAAARSPGCRASTRPSASCAATLRDGDVLLTLGAGDVDALGRRLLAA